MFQHQGIWLPDGERHFPEWMDRHGEIVDGRGTYQIKKWRACLPWIRNWRCAVDVGAHVGFWSIQMAQRFSLVEAFEPMPEFRECFRKNLDGGWDMSLAETRVERCVVSLHSYAIGRRDGFAMMEYDPADSGNTHVGQCVLLAFRGAVPMRALDEFTLQDVDFLKIDCEGYEHHVIEGARETLARCRPCVIVEQKQHKMAQNYPGLSGTPAVDLLTAMGAVVRQEIGGDYILSWP